MKGENDVTDYPAFPDRSGVLEGDGLSPSHPPALSERLKEEVCSLPFEQLFSACVNRLLAISEQRMEMKRSGEARYVRPEAATKELDALAMRWMERANSSLRKEPRIDAGEAAGIQESLALLHLKRGLDIRARLANPNMLRVLTIRKSLPPHLRAGGTETSSHLSVTDEILESLDTAAEYARRALRSSEKHLGNDCPETEGIRKTLTKIREICDEGEAVLDAARRLLKLSGVRTESVTDLPPERLDALSHLHLLLGEGEAAAALQEEALKRRERVFGVFHPETVAAQRSLALFRYALGDVSGARKLALRALTVLEKSLGPDHPSTFDAFGEVLSLSEERGDAAAADALYRRGVEIRKESFASLADAAFSLYELAEFHDKRANASGSSSKCSREIREEALLLFNRWVAVRENEIANAPVESEERVAFAKRMERFAERCAPFASSDTLNILFEKARAQREKALGVDRTAVASLLENFAAKHYREAKDRERAFAMFERAMELREESGIFDGRPFADYLDVFAKDHWADENRRAEAFELRRRAMSLRERTPRILKDSLILTYERFADSFYRYPEFRAEALSFYKRAVSLREEMLSANHRLSSMIGETLQQKREQLEAMLLDFYCEEKIFDRVPTKEEYVAVKRKRECSLHRPIEDFAEVLPFYERVCAITEALFAPGHSEIIDAMSRLTRFLGRYAAYLVARREMDKALPLLERVLSLRERTHGREHPKTVNAMGALGLLHRSAGVCERGDELLACALAMNERLFGADHPKTEYLRRCLEGGAETSPSGRPRRSKRMTSRSGMKEEKDAHVAPSPVPATASGQHAATPESVPPKPRLIFRREEGATAVKRERIRGIIEDNFFCGGERSPSHFLFERHFPEEPNPAQDEDSLIWNGLLPGVLDTTLFYPCCGNDLYDPIRIFSPWVVDFLFVDRGYFRPGDQDTRFYGFDRPAWSLPHLLADDIDYRLLKTEIDGPPVEDSSVRHSESSICILKETYLHIPTRRRISVRRCRGDGLVVFRREFGRENRSLGVFFYRGDSEGEGGSGIWWLGSKIFGEICRTFVDGALILTDGSQQRGREYSFFCPWRRKHSAPLRSYSDKAGREFTRFDFPESVVPSIWQVRGV